VDDPSSLSSLKFKKGWCSVLQGLGKLVMATIQGIDVEQADVKELVGKHLGLIGWEM
jgi:hypothetical protein